MFIRQNAVKRIVLFFLIACSLSLHTQQTWAQNKEIDLKVKVCAESNAIQTYSVRVGDIDIGYRITGNGQPLVLITGYSATMDLWDPVIIKKLSSQHKVIMFDNRGIGRTTTSEKPFSIKLFAEDTIGLMNALKIEKANILGWSMGTFIATEIALKYPERVNKLILYAGNCGWRGKDVVQANPEVESVLFDLSGTPEDRGTRLIGILYPKKWLDEHPGFIGTLPKSESRLPQASIEGQHRAIISWEGACGKLHKIKQPVLFITGTEDVVIPPANSYLMASRVNNSWLIRLPGGHSNMYQYPETFSRCLLTFLEAD